MFTKTADDAGHLAGSSNPGRNIRPNRYPSTMTVAAMTDVHSARASRALLLRLLLVLAIFLAAMGGPRAAMSAMPGHLSIQGKVTDVQVPSFGSGYIPAFVATTVVTGKREIKLLIPFFSETDNLPAVGKLCVFTYKKVHVDGLTGEEGTKPGKANVVARFTCVD